MGLVRLATDSPIPSSIKPVMEQIQARTKLCCFRHLRRFWKAPLTIRTEGESRSPPFGNSQNDRPNRNRSAFGSAEKILTRLSAWHRYGDSSADRLFYAGRGYPAYAESGRSYQRLYPIRPYRRNLGERGRVSGMARSMTMSFGALGSTIKQSVRSERTPLISLNLLCMKAAGWPFLQRRD